MLRRLVFLAGTLLTLFMLNGCGEVGNTDKLSQAGTLSIQIANLSSDELGGIEIQIRGPNDYYLVLHNPATLRGLKPGIYKVRFNGYPIGRTLYVPQAFNVLAEVVAGKTTTVEMLYSVLPDSYEVKFSKATVQLKEGDILGGNLHRLLLRKGMSIGEGSILLFKGSLSLFPEGFLRKVVNVENLGNALAVTTEPAKLDEAFEKLYLKLEKPVSPYEVAAALAEYKDGQLDLSKVESVFGVSGVKGQAIHRKLPIITPSNPGIGLELTPQGEFNGGLGAKIGLKGCATKSLATFGLEGCLGAEASFMLHTLIDIDFFQLKRWKFTSDITLDGSAELALVMEASNGDGSDRQEIAEVPLGTFPIGPIVLEPTAYAVYSFGPLKSKVGGKTSETKLNLITFSLKKTWSSGFDYTPNAGLKPIRDSSPLRPEVSILNIANPLDGSISVAAEVGVGVSGKLYGLAGPFVEVLVGPELDADLTCAKDPWWSLGFRGDAKIGLEAKLFKIIDEDVHESLELFVKHLADAKPILALPTSNLNVVRAGSKVKFSLIPQTTNPLCTTGKLKLNLLEEGLGERESTPSDLYVSPDVLSYSTSGRPVSTYLVASENAKGGPRQLRLYVKTGRTERVFALRANVIPSPTFTLSLDPDHLNATQGQSAQTTLTITPQNGFSGSVHLSLTRQDGGPAPSGLSVTPTSVNVPGSKVSQTLTIDVAASVAPGTYPLRLKGSKGTQEKVVNFTLRVEEGGDTGGKGDASQWTLRSGPLYGVAYGNGIYVAVGGDGGILVSSDGINWKPQDSGTGKSLSSVTYGEETFVAVGYDGTILTSADGVNWRYQDSGVGNVLLGVTYAANIFVAVGSNGAILTSPDGVNWTVRDSGTGNWLWGVTYGDGIYVIVGQSGTILTSSDGVNWTVRDSGTVEDLFSVAYGEGTFVAVGKGGTILTSSDGVNWTVRDSGTGNWLRGVAYGDDTFVVVTYGGTILTSSDGVNWTVRDSGTGNNLFSVTHGDGIYVIVGFGGTILTSSDGVNWTVRDPGTGNWLRGVAYGDGTFVAVGSFGAILTSSDGVNWTVRDPGTGSHLFAATYGGGAFVAVGDGGTILTSP